jgi:filamentous hemagglutinin family protein
MKIRAFSHPIAFDFALSCAMVGALAVLAAWGNIAFAGPLGGQVVSGSATVRSSGTQTDIIQTTPRAVIDWRQFDLGRGESVHFRQPDASSSTLNRVTGGDPSRILGTITANGQVILLNPNGVLFGREARVDTAGLVVSTSQLGSADFMAGRLNFTAPERVGAGAASTTIGSIVNEGTITVRDGGLAALVAPHVRNDGVIRADLGRVVLASGSSFTVDLAGDGLLSLALRDADLQSLSDAQGRAVTALVDNTGALLAPGGRVVVMTPAFASRLLDQAINLGGVVRADSASRDATGAITLSAANGAVALTGEIAAPGGGFTLQRDAALVSVDTGSAEALGRILRSGTEVKLQSSGRIDVAARIDGRGGESGAALKLEGASVGLRQDLYTQDGAVEVTARSGSLAMAWPEGGVTPERRWPLIMTGRADIRLQASGSVTASHLVTQGAVHIESTGGNVNIVASLGADANGASPLGSLTVRALGKADTRDVGNVSELYDVNVVAGGRIDIAATRNIQLFATGNARPGLLAARAGTGGRSLRLSSDRLGNGDLTTNTFYWTGLNSRARHVGRGSSPEDASGRWTNLQLTAKEAGNPTANAPPGPTNVLASAPTGGSGLSVLLPALPGVFIPDVLPTASTVIAENSTEGEAPGLAATGLDATGEGYSATRGLAQLADTGRTRSTSAPRDVFSLADHVVEVPACAGVGTGVASGVGAAFGGHAYFARGTFGQPLNIACR